MNRLPSSQRFIWHSSTRESMEGSAALTTILVAREASLSSSANKGMDTQAENAVPHVARPQTPGGTRLDLQTRCWEHVAT